MPKKQIPTKVSEALRGTIAAIEEDRKVKKERKSLRSRASRALTNLKSKADQALSALKTSVDGATKSKKKTEKKPDKVPKPSKVVSQKQTKKPSKAVMSVGSIVSQSGYAKEAITAAEKMFANHKKSLREVSSKLKQDIPISVAREMFLQQKIAEMGTEYVRSKIERLGAAYVENGAQKIIKEERKNRQEQLKEIEKLEKKGPTLFKKGPRLSGGVDKRYKEFEQKARVVVETAEKIERTDLKIKSLEKEIEQKESRIKSLKARIDKIGGDIGASQNSKLKKAKVWLERKRASREAAKLEDEIRSLKGDKLIGNSKASLKALREEKDLLINGRIRPPRVDSFDKKIQASRDANRLYIEQINAVEANISSALKDFNDLSKKSTEINKLLSEDKSILSDIQRSIAEVSPERAAEIAEEFASVKDRQAEAEKLAATAPTSQRISSREMDKIAQGFGKNVSELTAAEVAAHIRPTSVQLKQNNDGDYVHKDFVLKADDNGGLRLENIRPGAHGTITIPDAKGENFDVIRIENGKVVQVLDGGGGLSNKEELLEKQAEVLAQKEQTSVRARPGEYLDTTQRIIDEGTPEWGKGNFPQPIFEQKQFKVRITHEEPSQDKKGAKEIPGLPPSSTQTRKIVETLTGAATTGQKPVAPPPSPANNKQRGRGMGGSPR